MALSSLRQIKRYLGGDLTRGLFRDCIVDALEIASDLFGNESSHYQTILDATKLSSGIEVQILHNEIDSMIKEIESPKPIFPIKIPQLSDTQIIAAKEVFIVHGRDDEAKKKIANFVKGIGLKPIVLHEQPNEGRTIIEKFEHHSSVEYAVVLLTPDDVGGLRSDTYEGLMRARQNVIFEMGFFFGKLGRRKVCALISPGVEQPSDLHGLVYIPFDQDDEWKLLLERELEAAGLKLKSE